MKTILYTAIIFLFLSSFITENKVLKEWEVFSKAAQEIGIFVYKLDEKNTGHYKDWAEKRLKQWCEKNKVSRKKALLLYCKNCEDDSFFIMNMATVSLKMRRGELKTPMTLEAKEGSILTNTMFREFESNRGGYNPSSVSTRINIGENDAEKALTFLKAFENYQQSISN